MKKLFMTLKSWANTYLTVQEIIEWNVCLCRKVTQSNVAKGKHYWLKFFALVGDGNVDKMKRIVPCQLWNFEIGYRHWRHFFFVRDVNETWKVFEAQEVVGTLIHRICEGNFTQTSLKEFMTVLNINYQSCRHIFVVFLLV